MPDGLNSQSGGAHRHAEIADYSNCCNLIVSEATVRKSTAGVDVASSIGRPRGLFDNAASVDVIAEAMRQSLATASGLSISVVACLPIEDESVDGRSVVYQTGWTEGPGRPPLRLRVVAHYAPDGQAQRTHVVLRGLARAGFDGRGGFAVPRPLASVPSLSCRIEAMVFGDCLAESDLDESAQVIAHAEGAGRWLAHLHQSDVGGRLFGTRDERLSIEATIGRAMWIQPSAAARLRALGRFVAGGLLRVGQGRLSISTATSINQAMLAGYESCGGSGSLGRVGLWTSIELLHFC